MFKGYLRFRANRRAQQIGLDPMFAQAENPFPWMSEMIDLKKERNFFEIRAIEYQTGGARNWGEYLAPSSKARNGCHKQRLHGRLSPYLMHSEKPNCSYQFLPPDLTKSGEAAFSLKKMEVFQRQDSSASNYSANIAVDVFCRANWSIVAQSVLQANP